MAQSRIDPREKKLQRSVCFPFRQHQFFAFMINSKNEDYRKWDLNKYCIAAVDEQINMIFSGNEAKLKEFLSNEVEKNNGEEATK